MQTIDTESNKLVATIEDGQKARENKEKKDQG